MFVFDMNEGLRHLVDIKKKVCCFSDIEVQGQKISFWSFLVGLCNYQN